MRPVNEKEAKTSLDRMLGWTKSEKPSSGGSLGEWVYHEKRKSPADMWPDANALVTAKTPNAVQRKWRTPSEFPCCPQEIGETPIKTYADRLEVNAVFSRNQFSKSVIIAFAMSEDLQSLWVMCENHQEGVVKPWSLAQVPERHGYVIHGKILVMIRERNPGKYIA